ncbi:rcc01693 family protein [Paenochrobactrum sp. BZR 588]|uniref:rcc01693 family protein n=1 Tax=Paenochrobactrum TaxID=999488 RepID=UPI0035BC205E
MLNTHFESKSDLDSAFPWADVMQIGLGQFRLAPKDFWALSLRELNAMIGAYQLKVNVPDRQTLNELMQAYPDL